MLPQKNRLKKKRDIEIVFENGRFIAGKYLNMKLWHVIPDKFPKRNYTKDDLKIAFVVGKKVHKGAVKRNRIKRQMREVVRLLLKQQGLRVGNMVVIMAKPEIVGQSYTDIEKDILLVLEKGKLLSTP